MDWNYIALISITLSIFFILHQRIQPGRKAVSKLFIGLIFILLILIAALRLYYSETITAVVIALMVAFLFWLFIGRYNPVQDADKNIKVYGLDD